ncbi:MAG: pantetheine-phosphate adenylyltransferase [Traorella sp.]
MKIAMIPGSFDPITRGHLDVIERSSRLFDEVFVVIMENSSKKALFSNEEKLDMIQEEIMHLDNVKVLVGSGLTVDMAKKLGASVMIRGIRATSDYEYEVSIASVNMMLNGDIETMFLLSQPQYSFVSSSMVKEVASYHGNLKPFVSEKIEKRLKEKFL